MIGISKNCIRVLLICMALPALAACATGGPTFSEMQSSEPPIAANSGRIYLYRPASMVGAALHPSIKIDGTRVGDSVPGGYFYVDRPAGTYEVSAETEKEEDENVTLAAGQRRYVRFRASMGVLVGHIIPKLVDDSRGTTEIKDCHYIGK